MLFKIFGTVILLCALFLVVSLAVYYYDSNKRRKNRQPITKISIDSITILGDTFTSNELEKNKITLVNIWGTYCSFCIKELPDLQFIFEKYRDDGVGVVGIVTDLFTEKPNEKNLLAAKQIIKDNSITYPNVFLNRELKDYLTDKVFLVPTTFFVDNKGNVIGDVIENVCTKEQLEERIVQIKNTFS